MLAHKTIEASANKIRYKPRDGLKHVRTRAHTPFINVLASIPKTYQVEDSWKATEFIILPHRESKDVFILGGTDDIQQLLDDSNINMATIASSRHVGPIRLEFVKRAEAAIHKKSLDVNEDRPTYWPIKMCARLKRFE